MQGSVSFCVYSFASHSRLAISNVRLKDVRSALWTKQLTRLPPLFFFFCVTVSSLATAINYFILLLFFAGFLNNLTTPPLGTWATPGTHASLKITVNKVKKLYEVGSQQHMSGYQFGDFINTIYNYTGRQPRRCPRLKEGQQVSHTFSTIIVIFYTDLDLERKVLPDCEFYRSSIHRVKSRGQRSGASTRN